MKEDLLKIINHYGVVPQLKYFQSEVFELNEAIINCENDEYCFKKHIEECHKNYIAEEIADVLVMLGQFKEHYGIIDKEIEEIMKYKIERQLKRIEDEDKSKNN